MSAGVLTVGLGFGFATGTSQLATAATSTTLPTPSGPAWQCSPSAYLFQGNDDGTAYEINQIDLNTGASTKYASLETGVNAAGFNPLNNYVYGYEKDSKQIVSVASDGTITQLGLPAGVVASDDLNTGDITSTGKYFLAAQVRRNGEEPGWWEIDLDPSSATYGKVIASGKRPIPSGLWAGPDWSYIDGKLYSVSLPSTSATSKAPHLVSFDPTTSKSTDLGALPFTVPGDGTSGANAFGATYTDAAGYLYASYNTTGTLYRIDVKNLANSGLLAPGAPSFSNDGLRCQSAPLPGFSLAKTVDHTQTKVGDKVTYTVTITNTGGVAYTAANPASFTDDLSDVLDNATYNGDASSGAVVSGNTLTWSGPLAVDASTKVTYSVTVKNVQTPGETLTNSVAPVTGNGGVCGADCSTVTPIVPDLDTPIINPFIGGAAALALVTLGGVYWRRRTAA